MEICNVWSNAAMTLLDGAMLGIAVMSLWLWLEFLLVRPRFVWRHPWGHHGMIQYYTWAILAGMSFNWVWYS